MLEETYEHISSAHLLLRRIYLLFFCISCQYIFNTKNKYRLKKRRNLVSRKRELRTVISLLNYLTDISRGTCLGRTMAKKNRPSKIILLVHLTGKWKRGVCPLSKIMVRNICTYLSYLRMCTIQLYMYEYNVTKYGRVNADAF